MKNIFLVLSAFFFILSWVIYPYNSIIPTFLPELCAFISALFFISSSCNEKLKTIKVINYFFALSFIPIFQYLFGQIIYFQNFFFTFIYIFTFSFVVLNSSNQPSLFNKFIYLLIIASIFNSIVSIHQILGFEKNFNFMLELQGNRAYGNLGQPNNLSTLLIITLIGAIYLHQIDKLNKIYLSITILIILTTISLTQSRTGFLNLILFSSLLLINHKNLNIKIKKVTIFITSIIFSFIFIFIKEILIFFSIFFNINTINLRITKINIVNDGRVNIWIRSLELLSDNLFFGIGLNQSSIGNLNSSNIKGLIGWFSSSHNLLLDILLGCGLIIGGIIICLFSYVILKYKKKYNLKSMFSYFMIITLIFHSLLEFPLNYSYFLLTIAFLIGILLFPEVTKSKKNISSYISKISLIFGFILILVITLEYLKTIDNQIKANYLELERTLNRNTSHETTTPYFSTTPPLVLDFIDKKNNWIALNSFTKVNNFDINKYKFLVYNEPTPSNLFKLAQLYHYNNYINDRDRVLDIIEKLYKKRYTLNDIEIR